MNEEFMRNAISLAEEAKRHDEVPIGAVVVLGGEIIGRGRNRKNEVGCAVEHAEIVAIRDACERVGTWHLDGADLYVTLEPCPMCAGAIIMSRLANVYFGAYDEKAGCCGTLYRLTEDERFNHRCAATGGILREECAALLSDFFREKRLASKSSKRDSDGE